MITVWEVWQKMRAIELLQQVCACAGALVTGPLSARTPILHYPAQAHVEAKMRT